MNAPTDETQGKARPTQLGMTTACHFQTCSQIPCFICNRKKTACCFLSLLAQCFLFICERGDRAPQMTREWLWRLPAWGGGRNEMLQSVNARSGESWRRDKNVSIYANCCPDPPPGCHCLLSGEKIKGPSVLNLSRIRLYSAARHSSPFGVTRDSSEVLRGQHTRWCSFEAGSWFCLFKVSMEMPDCAQPTSPPEQRGRSCGVQSASDDWWLWRESAVCCRSSSPSFAGCEWARAGAEDAQDRRISARFERNNSLKMFGAMLLNPPKLTFARVIAKRNVWRQNKPTNLL